jgi:outer membrane protein assembly factor BamD (BamD/ComL family)
MSRLLLLAAAAALAAATAVLAPQATAQNAAVPAARSSLFSLEWRDATGYAVRPGATLTGRKLDTHAMRREALARLTEARRDQQQGANSSAIGTYDDLVREHPGTDIAAEAAFQRGIIHARRNEFKEAFDSFDLVAKSFPDFDRFDEVIARQFLVATDIKNGKRPYLWGRIPWFKDSALGVDFFERVNHNAPYGEFAARSLYDKGLLAIDAGRTEEALDAFDRIIWDYPDSVHVPDSWLALARAREAEITGHGMDSGGTVDAQTGQSKTAVETGVRGITGHEWDQGATRDALNYYNEFIRRFPAHKYVTLAVHNAARMKEILARNRYDLGLFYFEHRNNPRAAALFFHEAINIAPGSNVAGESRKRIAEIRDGQRAPAGAMDWLFGRYPQTKDTSYGDIPLAPDTAKLGFKQSAK